MMQRLPSKHKYRAKKEEKKYFFQKFHATERTKIPEKSDLEQFSKNH